MDFFRMFGIGIANAITGAQTEGIVAEVKTCWWLKINTKPVRTHAYDGAVFPHIIQFSYSVNGKTFQGKRYVSWNKRCPAQNERIAVYYEPDDPSKYAVII